MAQFVYEVVVETDSQRSANTVIAERLGYDEDLSDLGVKDYRIWNNGLINAPSNCN